MKWTNCGVALVILGIASIAQAQMGMDYFTRPAITKVFHPTVGKGSVYQTTNTSGGDGKTSTTEIGIVGKESVDGKDAYWVETSMTDPKGQPVVGKTLMSLQGEVTIHRVIFQQAGQPAMEMPMNMTGQHKSTGEVNLNDWHSVGTESVTVPAGTFTCEHWKNEKNGSEIWTSDKVPSYGVVKELSNKRSMVLVKIIDNYPDKITGPVQKFDMQQMMQQMQQQRQQKP
ncbi:MAG TPA: hypothetical protein VMJ35_07030 [Dongiaceae bacterium]|nr:hypothetical protein [Dongiaceae bacterium]